MLIKFFKNVTYYFLFFIAVVICKVTTAKVEIKNAVPVVEDRITKIHRLFISHSQLFQQIQKKIDNNQNDLEKLREQIQENQYSLSKLIKQQNDFQNQIDKIIKDYENIKTYHLNKKNINKKNKIISSQISSDRIDYNEAINLAFNKKKYSDAINKLKLFMTKYPSSNYRPNAQYWIGQIYYVTGNSNDAIYNFASVVQNFPNFQKVPDALLKIGILAQKDHQNDKAKKIYNKIIELYPNDIAAIEAKKRLKNI